MKECILFVVSESYVDREAAYLSSALQMLGRGMYEVKTVSLTKEPMCSIGGFYILPNYDTNSISADYEALILVEGMAQRNGEARRIQPLVEGRLEKGKALGSIHDASRFLGTTGVLNSVNHTSNNLNDLRQWADEACTGEQKYVMRQTVGDGNIITANGTAPLESAKEVLFALKAAPGRVITGWYNFHKLEWYNVSMPKNAASWNE